MVGEQSALIELGWRDPHFFNSEGLSREAINFFHQQKEKMYAALQKHDFCMTACDGFLTWSSTGKELEDNIRIAGYNNRHGTNYSINLKLSNIDETYLVPIVIENVFPFQKYLNTYCQVNGVLLSDKKVGKFILATEIFPAELTYNFEDDPQFSHLPVKTIEDVLSFFPNQEMANHEEKEIGILTSLIGAQEKALSKGGVGASLLLPSGIYSTRISGNDVKKLHLSVRNSWLPSSTRDVICSNTPSFLSGEYGDVMNRTVIDSNNLLKYKVNRELTYRIPETKGDPRVLEVLRYTHLPIYLDESIAWFSKCNALDMFLLRARLCRVTSSRTIVDDAKQIEQQVKQDLFEVARVDLRIPSVVLDTAECLAKMNGAQSVSNTDLQSARNLIYNLYTESRDELGFQTELNGRGIIEMPARARGVYNYICDYSRGCSVGDLIGVFTNKGVPSKELKRILNELERDGRIFKKGNVLRKA